MNKLKKYLLIGFVLCFVLLCGCGKSNEEVAKETLRNKYCEDFAVYEVDDYGGVFEATVAPVNNPDILFIARMNDDGTGESDDYYKMYVAKLVKDKLSPQIEQFFPECYIMTNVKIRFDSDVDVRGKTLEEIIPFINDDEDVLHSAHIYIYINKDVGTLREYEKEYIFFDNEIDEMVADGQMLPICVQMYWLDSEHVEKVRKYFLHDLDWDANYEEALGVSNYKFGINGVDQTDLGSPPNISMSFNKEKDGEIEIAEYVRRRELIENE